jgi:hypothetical protein
MGSDIYQYFNITSTHDLEVKLFFFQFFLICSLVEYISPFKFGFFLELMKTWPIILKLLNV